VTWISLLFYLFSGMLLGSALMVVTAKNTVYGVLFLILTFFNAAGLFVLLNAEFLAMMLVVVYVGAVAVLFLFVVMMLNVELGQPRSPSQRYSFVGGLVGGVLVAELAILLTTWHTSPEAFNLVFAPRGNLPNTQALGNLIYTHYILIFQTAGLILLVAMIGAIVLTLRHREGVRKQKSEDQLARQAKDSMRLVDIPHGREGQYAH
jgi:NADH-quinone oxidoreductase subunit J